MDGESDGWVSENAVSIAGKGGDTDARGHARDGPSGSGGFLGFKNSHVEGVHEVLLSLVLCL